MASPLFEAIIVSSGIGARNRRAVDFHLSTGYAHLINTHARLTQSLESRFDRSLAGADTRLRSIPRILGFEPLRPAHFSSSRARRPE
jgi:hypothetical protein